MPGTQYFKDKQASTLNSLMNQEGAASWEPDTKYVLEFQSATQRVRNDLEEGILTKFKVLRTRQLEGIVAGHQRPLPTYPPPAVFRRDHPHLRCGDPGGNPGGPVPVCRRRRPAGDTGEDRGAQSPRQRARICGVPAQHRVSVAQGVLSPERLSSTPRVRLGRPPPANSLQIRDNTGRADPVESRLQARRTEIEEKQADAPRPADLPP